MQWHPWRSTHLPLDSSMRRTTSPLLWTQKLWGRRNLTKWWNSSRLVRCHMLCCLLQLSNKRWWRKCGQLLSSTVRMKRSPFLLKIRSMWLTVILWMHVLSYLKILLPLCLVMSSQLTCYIPWTIFFPTDALGKIVRKGPRREWSYLYDAFIKTFSGKISNFDAITSQILQMLYMFLTNEYYNFGGLMI